MFFFVKTENPRPTFLSDMTEDERGLMVEHVSYWTALAGSGVALVFGPVLDPSGVYGVGVYEFETEDEMQKLLALDPAKDLLRSVALPMAGAVVGTRVRTPPDATPRDQT
jgi:uncharacterized protein YciI